MLKTNTGYVLTTSDRKFGFKYKRNFSLWNAFEIMQNDNEPLAYSVVAKIIERSAQFQLGNINEIATDLGYNTRHGRPLIRKVIDKLIDGELIEAIRESIVRKKIGSSTDLYATTGIEHLLLLATD